MSRIGWMIPIRRRPDALSLAAAALILAVAAAGGGPGAGRARAADAGHLILAEIQTLNSDDVRRPLACEFVEIVNPTGEAIDLSDVYLTDAVYAPGSQFYWRIAEGSPTGTTAGGGAFADFHARFPDGYAIAAGDTIVIAVGGGSGAYLDAYGRLPDFEVYEDGLEPDVVPELREAFPGAIAAGLSGGGNSPTLSDGSESLVLYTWDGTSDLVQDLDFAFWGGSSSILFDKTGVTVGGGTYNPDTPTAGQERISSTTLIAGQSYMRASADEGTETTSGGNGVLGHDETSENLGTTWSLAAAQDPALPPVAHHPTAPIISAHAATPAAPYAGQEVTLSVTALSFSALTGVTFQVAYERGPFAPVAGTDAGGGTYTATLPGQAEGTHVAWYAEVANGDGQTALHPVGGAGDPEEWTVAAEPQPGDDPDKLLLSEICTLGTSQEFIEITNPNPYAVDLSDYYLTDAVHTSNQYWMVTQPEPQNFVGGGSFNDFYARFPDGFTLAAGDTIVVSIPGSESFEASYGFKPELELYEDGSEADEVLDMLPLWGGGTDSSIRGSGSDPTLTNGGETVVLLFWDGESDLITDIDMFNWKDPGYTSTSFLFDKSGITVGASTYGPDTPTGAQTPFGTELSFGDSYQRIDLTEGAQGGTEGNGVAGRDETSEDLNDTFAMLPADPSPPMVSNPLAPAILTHSLDPATPGANEPATMSITAESPTPLTGTVFYYRLEGGEFTMVEGVITAAGGGVEGEPYYATYRATIPGQLFGTAVGWYAEVANEGGYTTRHPFAAPAATFNYVAGAEAFGLVVIPKTFIPTEGEAFPIRFNTRPDSETRLRIFDLDGRLVITLYDSRFAEGVSVQSGKFSQIDWDGRDNYFERVPAGMYIAHLSVVDIESGEEETWTAPVVVATRLSN